jgi:oligopeptidase B
VESPAEPPVAPPVARREPLVRREHGVERPDPYAWLHDDEAPEVLAYLSQERSWYDAATAHLHSLVETLRTEMGSRLPAEDVSPAWRRARFSYYTRYAVGSDHLELWREVIPSATPQSVESPPDRVDDDEMRTRASGPEVVLDVTPLAADTGYADLGLTLVSPDERRLAWSVDTTGDEVFTLRFRDLETGRDLEEVVARSYYGGAWSADSTTFFYTVPDEVYRPCEVWRHRVGTSTADDVLVLAEDDERFELYVRGTRSGDFVVVSSESNTTSEEWIVDAADPASPPRSVGGRRAGVRYQAEHRLRSSPLPPAGGQDPSSWTEARPERADERVERVDAFAGGLVVSLQAGGEHRLRILRHDDLAGPGVDVRPRFPAGEVRIARTPSYDADSVLVCDQAHLRPPVWSTVDLVTGERTEVLAGEAPSFDPDDYVTERRTFPAPDGVEVPATLLRHRDTQLDGSAPALVYGYGAYGYSWPPEWDPSLPSLLDRGVVWVHAHVRGGGELGRHWYLDGKLAAKQHTFDDQVAVAEGLAAAGLVDPARIASRGLSAGGLLQGAVFSQRPDRWRAVVAEVPAVDMVTTMFDEATPLTITEWEEWGDPRVREEFDRMLAWSPYDNPPPAGGRPDLLVTGALHDARVMVREPAKWVARLRETDPEWSRRPMGCLFRAETGAGAHVGPSGRFGHLAYEAEVAAWLLDRLAPAGERPRTSTR